MALSEYIYKSPPFEHQGELMELQCEKEVFAYLMEQGTGKSKPCIDTACYLYEEGEIRLFIVAAPNGVHIKWALEDVPLSLPDRIEHDVHVWKSDGTVRNQKGYIRLRDKPGDHLRILCINVEFLATSKGAELVCDLMKKYRCFLAIDESVSIMTIGAKRTQHCIELGAWAEFKRILTGTPVVKQPYDLFGQFYFLNWKILGERNFAAFKAQYGEFHPPRHPFVLNLMIKQNPALGKIVAAQLRDGVDRDKVVIPANYAYRAPMIPVEDEYGRPKYKNLEKLRRLIAPYSYRKTKEECFDLPPKVFQKRYFSMTPKQRAFYDDIAAQYRAVWEDKTIIVDHKLTVALRLHQIACGYMPTGDEDIEIPFFKDDESKNPRVKAIMDDLSEHDGQQIVWCRFKREVAVLKKLLGERAVTYYGDTQLNEGKDAKQNNKEAFLRGDAQFFIATAASGGIGHNFTNSSKAIFGSNSFSYYHRSQAEDRQHRHGAEGYDKVLYVDIEAEDSIDQDISASNRNKQDLADYMMGRPPVDNQGWLYGEG